MKQLDAKLLRIFVSENDKIKGRPAYEYITELARDKKMAGATVMRGLLGFGVKSHMHAAKILRLSEDLPIIIEIVDKSEKIDLLIPELKGVIREGLITIEDIKMFDLNS